MIYLNKIVLKFNLFIELSENVKGFIRINMLYIFLIYKIMGNII